MPRVKPWNKTKLTRHKDASLSERKRYLIVTEGGAEELYLGHFKTSTKLEIVVENPKASKQLSLVQRAIQIRDEQISKREFILDLDELWVVFDRDINPSNPNDVQNFNEAVALASREKIFVGLSNDAFELWYLLHFQEVSTEMHRRVLDEKLSHWLGRTYKSRHVSKVEDLYYVIKKDRGEALKRAQRMHEACLKDGGDWSHLNPLTLVYLLVNKIMSEEGFREE